MHVALPPTPISRISPSAVPPALLQHRGSLHVHILLWQDEEHAARTAADITATRCKYKPDPDFPDKWVPDVPRTYVDTEKGPKPTNVLADMNIAERAFRLVERKQIHTCRETANGCCRDKKPCRYGFPFQPNLEGVRFDVTSNR